MPVIAEESIVAVVVARVAAAVFKRATAAPDGAWVLSPSGAACNRTNQSFPGWNCAAVIHVGTERRVASSNDGLVTVNYIGDFALADSLDTLATEMLMVPETRSMNPEEIAE